MLHEISQKSKQTITTGIIIWFVMLGAQFIYLFVCFFLLEEGLYKAIYDAKVLNEFLFMNINIHTTIYIISLTVLIAGYIYFKNSYSKIVLETQEKKFDTADEEFKYFNAKYLSLMFVCLAVFEMIAILGIVVFLTTLNFTVVTNLVVIAIIGFLLVIPTKGKFNYIRD